MGATVRIQPLASGIADKTCGEDDGRWGAAACPGGGRRLKLQLGRRLRTGWGAETADARILNGHRNSIGGLTGSMDLNTWNLCLLAVSLGVGHTIVGVDHYLPLIAFARAGNWSGRKTAAWTLLCGLGHLSSSVILGLLGLALGLSLKSLVGFEALRGSASGWALFGFGLALMVWGLRVYGRDELKGSAATASEGALGAGAERSSPVVQRPVSALSWWLFVIFVLGPCEPLIPTFIYPAAQGSWWSVFAVTAAFSAATLGTMLIAVLLGRFGALRIPSRGVSFAGGRIAVGAAVAACGAMILIGW